MFSLVESVVARINHWTVRFLTYALIKSVLVGMKGLWSHLFLLPKKVIKKYRAFVEPFFKVGLIMVQKGLQLYGRLSIKC